MLVPFFNIRESFGSPDSPAFISSRSDVLGRSTLIILNESEGFFEEL
ncbi:unnamed protein product, partial [Arabidopsis halleri]